VKTIERHALYEAAVQDAPQESRFLSRLARRELGREVRSLREDFCGTFWLGHEWAKLSPKNTAFGFDLDARALAWGMQRHDDPAIHGRVQGHLADVRTRTRTRFDLAVALNFSYFIFKERADLLEYFRAVRASLKKPGLLVLDHTGGPEIYKDERLRRRCRTEDGQVFHYVWEKNSFDPVTHHGHYSIHFEPKGGRRLRDAFVYDWRIWTLPELADLLKEAGFRRVRVYVEGSDDVFRTNSREWSDFEQWLAYIVALA
jgi:hypothetical protein